MFCLYTSHLIQEDWLILMFFFCRNWKRAVMPLLIYMFIIWLFLQAVGIPSCWQTSVLCTLCTMTSLVDGRYLKWFPELLLSAFVISGVGIKKQTQRPVLIFLEHNLIPCVPSVLCLSRPTRKLVRSLCLPFHCMFKPCMLKLSMKIKSDMFL